MKLEIELVPSTAWYSNVRKMVSREEWDQIRKKCYADAGYKCEICGATNVQLNCHEKWSYDDNRHIQKLKGFIGLCENCHWIKHLGLAGIRASEGTLDMEKLIQHYLRVNGVNRAEFERQRDEAFNQWQERSKHQWKTELGNWKAVVQTDSKQKKLWQE
jgi:hypothetical protein